MKSRSKVISRTRKLNHSINRNVKWKTIFSAALIILAFPPWNLWPLIFVGLVPWLLELDEIKTQSAHPSKERVYSGLLLGYLVSIGAFFWVGFVLREFGALPWWQALIGLLLFGFVGQPQFLFFAGAYQFFPSKFTGWRAPLLGGLLALSYAGIDWALPKIFMDTLGHSLYQCEGLSQLADLGGAHLITALVFFTNFSLFELTRIFKHRSHRSFKTTQDLAFPHLVALGLALGGALLYGTLRLQAIEHITAEAPRGLQAAAIQANIGDFQKIAAEGGEVSAATRVIDTLTGLTDQALALQPKPEIIIWPETSFPSTFRTPHSTLETELDHRVESFVESRKITLLFGGYDHKRTSEGLEKDYNALFMLAPEQELQVYRKNILLLFGEFIPGADSIPLIKELFPQVGNFGRGVGPTVLTLPGPRPVKTGPIICYEALFPNYVIQAARNGSEFILNITNDSWFGVWGEPQLHLALSSFRSIETRLPMLRTTNTGISALVLPSGKIVGSTPLEQEAILNVNLPLTGPIWTLMKQWGDWFGITALLLSTIILGFLRKNSRLEFSDQVLKGLASSK